MFFAFFQLTTIGYLISYFIPIALIFFRGRHLLPPAYWRMPDGLARFCNIVALLYIPFICVLFCIPNFYPVTPTNMNCERDLPPLSFLDTDSRSFRRHERYRRRGNPHRHDRMVRRGPAALQGTGVAGAASRGDGRGGLSERSIGLCIQYSQLRVSFIS